MKIEIKPADNIADARALSKLDRRIFSPSDCFDDPELWKEYKCFWIVVDGKIAGSTSLALNKQFSDPWDTALCVPGCMYLSSTGILPKFRGKGIGNFVKQWQIDYAKSLGLTRISTNCRASNHPILSLNRKFGFEVVTEVKNYYEKPVESTLVMELPL